MTERERSWALLGIGGAASLCCLGSAAVGGAAFTGGAVAGGTLAGGLGAGLVQVLVTVLTVGVLGLVWQVFGGNGEGSGNGEDGEKCERR